jgi:oligogalacturonide transport system permease protein
MRKISAKTRREWLVGYAFILLWLIGFGLFTLFPVIQSFRFSLSEVRITSGGLEIVKWLGIGNYRSAFTYVYFVEALWIYVKNTLITIPSILFFSVIIGLLLNVDIKGRGLFRTIYFLPVIISSGPVLAKIQSEGALVIPSLADNAWIGMIRGGLPDFLSLGIESIFGKIVLILWFTGVPVILIIAGLQKIDHAIYEAAAIDGASPWEAFWEITLPSLKPLLNVTVVFSMVSISMFASNDVFVIINSRRLTQYGLANAFSWIYFATGLILLGVFLLLINIGSWKPKRIRRKAMKRHA